MDDTADTTRAGPDIDGEIDGDPMGSGPALVDGRTTRVGLGVGVVALLLGIWSSRPGGHPRPQRHPRPHGHADDGWAAVRDNLDLIKPALAQGQSVIAVHDLLAEHGVTVPHRTLHVYARCFHAARAARGIEADASPLDLRSAEDDQLLADRAVSAVGAGRTP